MLLRLMPSRKNDGRCLPCFSLAGESAHVEPHAALSAVDRAELRSGTREEFVCASCGQRMIRFLALQTSPPPSNRWRFELPAIQTVSRDAPAPVEPVDDESAEESTDIDDPIGPIDPDQQGEGIDI
jgi:hypothetical protein